MSSISRDHVSTTPRSPRDKRGHGHTLGARGSPDLTVPPHEALLAVALLQVRVARAAIPAQAGLLATEVAHLVSTCARTVRLVVAAEGFVVNH